MGRQAVWIDDDADHSEEEQARLDALARRWSSLHDAEEQRMFIRQSDAEQGYLSGNDYDEPCEECYDGLIGVEYNTRRQPAFSSCVKCRQPEFLVGISCTACEGTGRDLRYERAAKQQQAEHDLEIEIVERMIHEMGARLYRAYEHWNEDEKLMEYAERER